MVIRFDNVTKMLGGRCILDRVSFTVEKGDVFVIVGPSGAGKSVTLKHMVHLLTPDSGDVYVGEERISECFGAALERLRERFGYLFQGGALLAWLSVLENVALPLREKTALSEEEIVARAAETLRLVGLEEDGNKMPAEISGGMCKRAGLARAVVRNPEIVLYDEPTSGLDPVTARHIDALIARTREEHDVTSVVVTHDLHSALSIGTRIAMLYRGRIVELAEPAAFIRSREPAVRDFLHSQYITRQGIWERNLQ
jgi:phospholipid/cholesterol/gamma-HCH transport system ATP-binding protein